MGSFMEPVVFLKPQGGLCNRLRVVDSGIMLARALKRKLVVVWEENEDLGAGYGDLFVPIPAVEVLDGQPVLMQNFQQ